MFAQDIINYTTHRESPFSSLLSFLCNLRAQSVIVSHWIGIRKHIAHQRLRSRDYKNGHDHSYCPMSISQSYTELIFPFYFARITAKEGQSRGNPSEESSRVKSGTILKFSFEGPSKDNFETLRPHLTLKLSGMTN